MEKDNKKRHCSIPHLYDHLDCTGAYGILYKPDEKFKYIGCAINIKTRWRMHRTATNGKHYNDEFHKDLRANPDNYECIVLYEYDGVIKDKHDLREKLVPIECFLIEHFKLLGHPIVTSTEKNLGTFERSDETKAKLSTTHIGKNVGENNPCFGRTGENHPAFGTRRTEEQKQKMRSSMIGKNKGKIKITNGLEERCVTQEDYKDNYDHTIWIRGRKKSA